MKFLRAVVLAAVVLALTPAARAAVDDAGCIASLADAFGSSSCWGYFDSKLKYTCPSDSCKANLLMIAQPCLAEGYRLADQVLAAVKAGPDAMNLDAAITADSL